MFPKETTAEELKGKRIKIIATDILRPHDVQFIRLDTDEAIQNVREAHFVWEAGKISRVTLWLIRLVEKEVKQEAVVCDAPLIEAVATTVQEEAVDESWEDHDAATIDWQYREIQRLQAELDLLKEGRTEESHV